MPALKSSNLAFADYNQETETLTVGFRSGTTYEYEDVPVEVYMALMSAPSAGSYFYAAIRDVYTYRQV